MIKVLHGAFFSVEISSLSEKIKARIQNRMNNYPQKEDIDDDRGNEGE